MCAMLSGLFIAGDNGRPPQAHKKKLVTLKAKFQCHPARCLLPVEIMERCGLATGPATVVLLPYLLPY